MGLIDTLRLSQLLSSYWVWSKIKNCVRTGSSPSQWRVLDPPLFGFFQPVLGYHMQQAQPSIKWQCREFIGLINNEADLVEIYCDLVINAFTWCKHCLMRMFCKLLLKKKNLRKEAYWTYRARSSNISRATEGLAFSLSFNPSWHVQDHMEIAINFVIVFQIIKLSI